MKKLATLIAIFLFAITLFAQEEVKIKDGRTIIINKDGTWKYKQELKAGNTFTDPRDNHIYKTVTIGTQTWFAENLAFKPNIGVYWALENDNNNVLKYGYLYDWETSKKGCPIGWHLPSDNEWTILSNYLGGEKLAGGKLKSMTGWDNPNAGASNSSKFNALPGGAAGCFGDGCHPFVAPGNRADFWSSSSNDANFAWSRTLFYDESSIKRFNEVKTDGYSIRCIKDK